MLTAMKDGLAVSPMVGEKFSTNGDYAGFIDYSRPADQSKLPYNIFSTRGPINTSHVMFRNGALQANTFSIDLTIGLRSWASGWGVPL